MRGFTLIELLIVIGIFVIVGALSAPFLQSFQVSSDLYTHAYTINKTLRRAQQQAIIGKNGSSWGVYFDNGAKKFVLFKGQDYLTRDQSFDQEIEYPQSFSVSTDFGDEVYFFLYSGQPSITGTTTITSLNNDSQDISISNSALIQLNE